MLGILKERRQHRKERRQHRKERRQHRSSPATGVDAPRSRRSTGAGKSF